MLNLDSPKTTKITPAGSIITLHSSSESMFRRLLKGFGAQVINHLIVLANRVLLIPFFLKAWGVSIYGEWLLLSSFVAYLSLTEMGGQVYIVNRLAQAYAHKDFFLFRKILHTGLILFLIIPTIAFSVFVIATFFISPSSLLHITRTDRQSVIWVLSLLAVQFLISLPQGILLGVYRATALLPRGVMVGNLVPFFQFIFTLLGLWFGVGMIGVAGLQIIPVIIVSLIALQDLNRRFPQFELISLKKDIDIALGRTFVKPSLHFFSIQLSQMLSFQGTILIVGVLLGSVQAVIFSTLRTMVNTMRLLLSLVVYSSWAEITRLDAEEKKDQLFIFFRGLLRTSLIASAVLVIILHYYGDKIIHFWIGDVFVYQQSLMDLFLLYIFQLVFWTLCSSFLMAINVHQNLSKGLLISSTLSILLAYYLGQHFALAGIVSGMILADLLLPFWLVPYLIIKQEKKYSPQFFFKEILVASGAIFCVIIVPFSTPVVFILVILWLKDAIPMDKLVLKR